MIDAPCEPMQRNRKNVEKESAENVKTSMREINYILTRRSEETTVESVRVVEAASRSSPQSFFSLLLFNYFNSWEEPSVFSENFFNADSLTKNLMWFDYFGYFLFLLLYNLFTF